MNIETIHVNYTHGHGCRYTELQIQEVVLIDYCSPYIDDMG